MIPAEMVRSTTSSWKKEENTGKMYTLYGQTDEILEPEKKSAGELTDKAGQSIDLSVAK